VPLPDRPTYHAAISLLLLEAGDPTLASATLRRFLGTSPEEMVKDAEWIEAHWALAEIATALEHPEAATRLFDTLRPYEGLWAVDGIGGAIAGTIAHQLGRLAAFLGRRGQAGAYLHAALDQYRAAGAPLLAQQVEAALAGLGTASDTAGPPEHLEGRLRREGRVWQLEWRGRSSVVPDSRGMRDLAVLLARPRRPVPALDLVAASGGPVATGGDLDRSSTPPHDGPTAPASPSWSRRSMRRRRTRTSAAPNGCAPSSR
jgi:hypothetical protein